jgi:hypothetical protein
MPTYHQTRHDIALKLFAITIIPLGSYWAVHKLAGFVSIPPWLRILLWLVLTITLLSFWLRRNAS